MPRSIISSSAPAPACRAGRASSAVAGRGARIAFNGANMLAGKEHGDLALVVEHAAPNSASRELFKNVVDGQAQGAFQGRIVVKPGRSEDRRAR